jgi:hypothetical protein
MSSATFVVETPAGGRPVLRVTQGANTAQNELFTSVANSFNTATPGSYKQILESIARSQGQTNLTALLPKTELDKVTNFYVTKNISSPWDSKKQGIQPPVGEFDSAYYAKQNPDLLKKWSDASKGVTFGGLVLPDVDITKRYDQNTFLHQHYSTTGKASGLRGNAAQEASAASTYKEKRQGLTDKERQEFRDTILGIGTKKGKAPIDATIEQIVNQENQNRFNYLVQDVLKNTVEEVNKARQKESQYDFYAGMPGFDEILNFRSTLSNSLLGDSGIGGYLAMTGQGDAVKKLEKGVESLLGAKDSVSYNWQKWFDESLASRYENLKEISDPADAKKTYALDKKFAKTFIDDYLRPRFDNSKSMSEFISYMDVKDNEQNILQTQTVTNKLKQLGMQKADSFLGQLANKTTGYFDADFYFNPKGNDAKAGLYTNQKADVTAAWNQAKTKPGEIVNGLSWSQWAYKYGLDVKDKEQFAKLHYEIIGKNKGFDPSSDKPTTTDLFNYINNELTPYLAEAKRAFGDSVFLQFMTPDQLADQLVSQIDPLRTPEAWDKTLKEYGIDGTNKSIDEVKALILTATRTAPAENIRASIEELNKQKKTPTQKELGIDYIQRASDDVKRDTGKETPLYNIFKKAGYGGTEDEFYTNFMPDVDRADQEMISGALKGKMEFPGFNIDTSDPFAAIGSIESFFSDKTKEPTKSTGKDTYFTLFGDAEKEAEKTTSSSFNFFSF